MLLSMTGFGDARHQTERLSVAVEVRAVNSRYLKILTKCPEAYTALEPKIEKLVRGAITRGTVTVVVRVEPVGGRQLYRLSPEVLEGYWKQLRQLAQTIHVPTPTDLGGLLQLPGVVSEDTGVADCASDWPAIQTALSAALETLQEFRRVEGQSMEEELRSQCRIIVEQLERIADGAPQVVEDYRNRLHERVQELLQGTDVAVDSADLIREVSIFAERCDINEEITRLRSHLDQFADFLGEETSLGRKLEFLSQELHREVNTIGSKANNVSIARCVVEMKSAVEKMREVLQNVE